MYLSELDRASIDLDVGPFAAFTAQRMKCSMEHAGEAQNRSAAYERADQVAFLGQVQTRSRLRRGRHVHERFIPENDGVFRKSETPAHFSFDR